MLALLWQLLIFATNLQRVEEQSYHWLLGFCDLPQVGWFATRLQSPETGQPGRDAGVALIRLSPKLHQSRYMVPVCPPGAPEPASPATDGGLRALSGRCSPRWCSAS